MTIPECDHGLDKFSVEACHMVGFGCGEWLSSLWWRGYGSLVIGCGGVTGSFTVPPFAVWSGEQMIG